MATRVFRAVRFGAIRNTTPSTTGIQFSVPNPRVRSNEVQRSAGEYSLSPRINHPKSDHRLNITITQQTEVDREEQSITKPVTLDEDRDNYGEGSV